MSLTGYIKNLFIDKEKTIPLFPRTKVKAVSDDDGVGLNVLLDEIKNEITPMSKGGTNATDGATGLKNLFAAGETILSDYQYGPEKPVDGRIGQVFFEEATGTIADIGQDVAAAVRAVNLLDNSDFRKPVNQRGATSYTVNGYTIDRWKLWSTTNGTGTVTLDSAGGITITAASGKSTFSQFFEEGVLDANKSYTFAYMTTDGLKIENDAVKVLTSGTTAGTKYVEISVESSSVTVLWAALYEGTYTAETLPPYVPKGRAAELLECCRYYQRSYESTPKTGGSGPIMIFLAASSYAGGSVLLPLEMRVTPTVTLYNPDTGNSGVVCDWSNSADVVASPNATRKGFQVRGGGRFTQGKYYGCHYEANADL